MYACIFMYVYIHMICMYMYIYIYIYISFWSLLTCRLSGEYIGRQRVYEVPIYIQQSSAQRAKQEFLCHMPFSQHAQLRMRFNTCHAFIAHIHIHTYYIYIHTSYRREEICPFSSTCLFASFPFDSSLAAPFATAPSFSLFSFLPTRSLQPELAAANDPTLSALGTPRKDCWCDTATRVATSTDGAGVFMPSDMVIQPSARVSSD